MGILMVMEKANVSLQCNERDSFAVGCIRLFDGAVELAPGNCES
jgi:hypothetical protein